MSITVVFPRNPLYLALLAGAGGTDGQTGAPTEGPSQGPGGGGVDPVTYLFSANFDVEDQTFTDGQVLGASEGVQVGSLTIFNSDAFGVKSGHVEHNIYQNNRSLDTEVPPVAGTGIFGDASSVVTTNPKCYISINNTVSFGLDGATLRCSERYLVGPAMYPVDPHDENELCMVLGGYNENFVPWDGSSDIELSKRGCAGFFYDGVNWVLIYRLGMTKDNIPSPQFILSGTSTDKRMDNLRIPDADLSAVLQPLVLDTFTDVDGTLLTAHTPDVDSVGGGWSQHLIHSIAEVGEFTIDASGYASGTNYCIYDIDSGVSDVVIEAVFRSSSLPAVVLRHTDIASQTDAWRVGPNASTLVINERNGGSDTTRASVAHTWADGDRIVAIADGQTITAYAGDAVSCTYALATLNEIVTTHGVGCWSFPALLDNFAIYPRKGAQYDILDNYPGEGN